MGGKANSIGGSVGRRCTGGYLNVPLIRPKATYLGHLGPHRFGFLHSVRRVEFRLPSEICPILANDSGVNAEVLRSCRREAIERKDAAFLYQNLIPQADCQGR